MLVGDFLFLWQSVAGTCRQVLPNASGSQLLHLQEMFRCHLSGQSDMQGRFRDVMTSYMLTSVLAALLYLPVNMKKDMKTKWNSCGFFLDIIYMSGGFPYLAFRTYCMLYSQTLDHSLRTSVESHFGTCWISQTCLKELTRCPHN